MVRKNLSQLCCLIVLLASIQPPLAIAQGMNMGRGVSGGMSGPPSNSANDPPPEPEKPVVKFNPFAADAAPVQGLQARIAALEKFVFGRAQTSPKTKLRVQRLEKKLVPYEHHAASEEDLEKRVDHLWTTIEKGNKGSTKAPNADTNKDAESKADNKADSKSDKKKE